MAQTQLLSDLCSICHSETPKYRCPRCKTQTCSLPCYKRHQQRAACSGKRDPAAYVKKNDLATPTGVDRDYNFLKSVERTIEDANRSASQNGLGAETPTDRRKAASARHPHSALSRYLERNSITIQHAPVGMSRQKSNNTRTTKNGNIHWTVEWVDAQGERNIRDDCLESSTMSDLYAAVQHMKEKEKRRQLEIRRAAEAQARRKGLKRKREQDLTSSQRKPDKSAVQNETEFLQSVKSDDVPSAMDPNADEHSDGSSSPVRIHTEPSDLQESPGRTENTPTTSQKPGRGSPTESESASKLYFYLLKPTTATATRVVIPLKAEATLTESLQNQTVLEYPTIYALPNPPEALGEQFMLEADHLESIAKLKAQADGPNQGDERGRASAREPRYQEAKNDEPLDSKSILALLKRDIAL